MPIGNRAASPVASPRRRQPFVFFPPNPYFSTRPCLSLSLLFSLPFIRDLLPLSLAYTYHPFLTQPTPSLQHVNDRPPPLQDLDDIPHIYQRSRYGRLLRLLLLRLVNPSIHHLGTPAYHGHLRPRRYRRPTSVSTTTLRLLLARMDQHRHRRCPLLHLYHRPRQPLQLARISPCLVGCHPCSVESVCQH